MISSSSDATRAREAKCCTGNERSGRGMEPITLRMSSGVVFGELPGDGRGTPGFPAGLAWVYHSIHRTKELKELP